MTTDTQAIATKDDRAINAFSSADAFATAQRMALALCSSSLVPSSYQGKKNLPNVMIAMEIAARIGASAFAVMQNIDIIHGRPSWRSQFLIATVNACGRFTPLRYRFEGDPNTPDWGCRAVARDKETDDECVGTLITLRLAQTEGWMSKSGSKWKTMPEQMLRYRAAAFWTRVYAPELSLGIHTREEIIDISAQVVHSTPTISLKDRLAQAQAGEPEPEVDVAADVEPEHDEAPEPPHDPETGEVADDPTAGAQAEA